MKQRSNDVIIQKAREHATFYYFNGNYGLYKEFPDELLQILPHIQEVYQSLTVLTNSWRH